MQYLMNIKLGALFMEMGSGLRVMQYLMNIKLIIKIVQNN